MPLLKFSDGISWLFPKSLRFWNGATWVFPKSAKYWNGATWVEISYGGKNVFISSYDGAVRKINPSGQQVWVHNFAGPARGVELDPDGYIYAIGFHGIISGDERDALRKINPSGGQVWAFTEPYWDGYDYIYLSLATGKNKVSYTSKIISGIDSNVHPLEGINTNGSRVYTSVVDEFTGYSYWSISTIKVDKDNNVYIGAALKVGSTIRSYLDKFTPTLKPRVWSLEKSITVVVLDAASNVYVDENNNVTKYSPSGSYQGVVISGGGKIQEIDKSGNYYTINSNNKVRKYNQSGNLVMEYTETSGSVGQVSVDLQGFIYYSRGSQLKKLTPNGSLIWTYTSGGSISDIAAEPGPYGAFPELW